MIIPKSLEDLVPKKTFNKVRIAQLKTYLDPRVSRQIPWYRQFKRSKQAVKKS